MQLLNRKRNKKSRTKILFVFLSVVVLIFSVSIIRPLTTKFFSSAWKESNTVKDFISDQSILRTKSQMRKEITRLKEENQRLVLGLQNKEEIERENQELRSLVSRVGKKTKRIMLPIIAKPNQSLYDTLILSLDTDKTITPNAYVFTEPESIIGTIDTISGNHATVLLFSKSERQTTGRLERTKQDVVLIGRGSGNFIIKVPVDTDVVLGDRILYPEANNVIIGVVRNVSNDDRNPSKILHVTSFVNVLELSDVYVSE